MSQAEGPTCTKARGVKWCDVSRETKMVPYCLGIELRDEAGRISSWKLFRRGGRAES